MKNKKKDVFEQQPEGIKDVDLRSEDEKSSGEVSAFQMRLPQFDGRFSAINRMIVKDLEERQRAEGYQKFSRESISKWLKDPKNNQANLREAVVYLYGVSSHYRRLIQYFVMLSDLSYVVSPRNINTSAVKKEKVVTDYKRTLKLLSAMDIKNSFEKILTVCLREDIFYGTIREGKDSTIIQQLPSEYCCVPSIEDNTLNVAFDFSYFKGNESKLELYPPEFTTRYEAFKKDNKLKIQPLDSPESFAIKANKDFFDYAMPPFAGILREIYDIEDYKELKMTKTELENYALLIMTIGTKSDGKWTIDLNKAQDFYHNLDDVVPKEIGTVLSPMPIEKIDFDTPNNADKNAIADAEQSLFTSAGVSSLLFNNEKASSNALLLSIKADQGMTYSIVKSIESMLNRFIHRHSFGKNFKVTFLDCSPYNRKEYGDAMLKACQYGLPMISYYCASQGLMQEEIDTMNFLEDDLLGLKEKFKPLASSSTLSSKDASGEPGRSLSEAEDLTDAGENTREDE